MLKNTHIPGIVGKSGNFPPIAVTRKQCNRFLHAFSYNLKKKELVFRLDGQLKPLVAGMVENKAKQMNVPMGNAQVSEVANFLLSEVKIKTSEIRGQTVAPVAKTSTISELITSICDNVLEVAKDRARFKQIKTAVKVGYAVTFAVSFGIGLLGSGGNLFVGLLCAAVITPIAGTLASLGIAAPVSPLTPSIVDVLTSFPGQRKSARRALDAALGEKISAIKNGENK